MSAKGRQTPRKPATKFAQLRKKMEKNRIAANASKKKASMGGAAKKHWGK